MLRKTLSILGAISALALMAAQPNKPSYLFVWAGDADGKASDFLGVSFRADDSLVGVLHGLGGHHPAAKLRSESEQQHGKSHP